MKGDKWGGKRRFWDEEGVNGPVKGSFRPDPKRFPHHKKEGGGRARTLKEKKEIYSRVSERPQNPLTCSASEEREGRKKIYKGG